MPPVREIDVVYTWVDGSRPDYAELVARHSSRPRDANPERFRDDLELLRYSLRSLERHAPWIRRVYLFTCRPQVPEWLRADHPRLRVVHHDEVAGEPGLLPTFNSNVIETLLDRLPGLSEHFLYLNDDYLLGAPVSPADFYAPDGRIKVFGTVAGERFRRRVYERQIISLGPLEHGPLLIERRAWREMQIEAAEEIAELHRHRFRDPRDLRPDRLYRWHLLACARDRAVAEPFWSYLPKSAFHKIRGHDAPGQRRALGRILRRRPRFVCLNDDRGDRPDPEVNRAVRAFLAELLPTPSSWEREQADSGARAPVQTAAESTPAAS